MSYYHSYDDDDDEPSEQTLNLHGLHVDEAMDLVEEFLSNAQNCYDKVFIITGYHWHLPQGHARLKRELYFYLKREGYKYYWKNRGEAAILLN